MISDVTQVRRWLARLDPASEEHPPIAIVRSIARLANPDRAAAAWEVEALLRRVHDVTETADDVEFYVAGDAAGAADAAHVTAGELASLVVDAALGQEETT